MSAPATEDCDHDWQHVADQEGDARESRLYADASVMRCWWCGIERPVTEADLDAIRAESMFDLDY